MGGKKLWWGSVGLAITIWGVSASLRAMTSPLNKVYGARETRGYKERLLTSLAGGVLVMLSLFAAILVVLGGRLVHPPGAALAILFFVGRWVVTFALLLLTIAMIIRIVPAKKRPIEWVSIGSALSVVCWVVGSIGFGAYISAVSYTSFYGALAGLVLLLVYLHVTTIAFLLGVVVDALLREEVRRQERGR
jgi:membrane protein